MIKMASININLSEKTLKYLQDFSKESNIELEKLCEVILDTFVDFGGRLFTGDWKEGIRLVIDWPSKLHFAIVKIRKEEMQKTREV